MRAGRRVRLAVVLVLVGCWLAGGALWAGGPRWVTGLPYFDTAGTPVVWYTNQPMYFTDPGNLSASVNHAAADAMVAAAAAVWNAPTSSLTLGYGGSLAEDVNGANVYMGADGAVFPADVQSSNYMAKQIAVVYDGDGSVTDMLLGRGASDPSGCRQNAVTESVDSIAPAGYIQHAVLVLNGRCTGPDPAQQLQMQYQLERAFGRVLGLGWSQTNDNVFTGSPQPSYDQAMNWPIMHPIDIICGPYTYQCLPQPFTLRPDDLSGLAQLYPIAQGQAPAGKTDTLLRSDSLNGLVLFPTGQGMRGVNVVGRRWRQYWNDPEEWYTVSSVSGYRFKRDNGNPVTGSDTSANGSMGIVANYFEGYYDLTRIPMLDGDWQNVIIETEPVNPLYTGQYAVGPYTDSTVVPSGVNAPYIAGVLGSYSRYEIWTQTTAAAAACSPGGDGTEGAPAVVAASGWWMGLLCAEGHVSWGSFSVRGKRTWTIEVTAQDEQGFATPLKAKPVIGLWNATDSLGTLPGVAAAPEAFNGQATGMTTLTAQSTQPEELRIAVADQRGDGRPDYSYQARLLYADSVTPANLTAQGGTITISGMGFRAGNVVTVNGVAAAVSSWTSNAIVATAPTLAALGSSAALMADVAVKDRTTGGTTVMSKVLTYGVPVPVLVLISGPSGSVTIGTRAAVPFSVKVVAADGVSPVVGEAVGFTATSGVVQFGACGAASCVIFTDSRGIASTMVTPQALGTIALQATGVDGSTVASFQCVAPLADVMRPVSAPSGMIFTGATASVPFSVQVLKADGVTPVANQSIVFSASGGSVQFGACGGGTCTVQTDASGMVSVTVTPLTEGSIVLSATGQVGTLTASFTAMTLVRTVSAVRGVEYLAAGATVQWTVQVSVADNSAAPTGVMVDWSVAAGAMAISPVHSQVSANGYAETLATAGPLAGGMQAVAYGCAWGTVCASIVAQGVDAGDLRLVIVSGAGQALQADDTLVPVELEVTDAAGHPVAGAIVQVHQTVEPWEMPCPDRGRCPVAPVKASSQSTLLSDGDGLVTVAPMQTAGLAGVTNIAVSAGTQGFVSLSLQKQL